MRFRLALIICGLYMLLITLSGCETVKGVAKGFSQDWQNTADNIEYGFKQTDKWIRENLW
jgi:predicted small secreted protein